MSFPRYPAYKPSGVEWLGEVSEHWEVKPLKRVAEIQTGLAKGKASRTRRKCRCPISKSRQCPRWLPRPRTSTYYTNS
jgi:type I restriction enzyme S subunit